MTSNSFSVILMLMCASLNASTLVLATREFKVGGDLGWLEPVTGNTTFYNQWAVAHRFRIGDSLVFEYNNDSVIMVEKWGYYHCDSSNAIIAFNDGNSTVELDRSGLFYFISGSLDHCKRGQRLIVDVMSPKPPPSAAFPPNSSFEGSPSPAQISGSLSVSLTPGLLLVLLVFVETLV